MDLNELLKQSGVKEEVIAGLPAEVVSAVTGFVSDADAKLAEATTRLQNADQTNEEVQKYVADYGADLVRSSSLEAENKALRTALESIQKDGFKIEIPKVAEAAVPGSPARGGNLKEFDPETFSGQVGTVMARIVDANNEHIRLTGQPLPDSIETIAAEAKQARITDIKQFVEQKYKFADIRKQKSDADLAKKLDDAKKAGRDEATREIAERNGGSPFLRQSVTSTNPHIARLKSEDIKNSSGNIPKRERLQRVLDGVHKDLASQQTA